MERSKKDNLPIILFKTEKDWEKWLEKNGNEPGVWVKIAKKNSGIKSINYQQALDLALCYGWIDGLKHKYDETFFLQRFTARKPKSNWSKVNREKVERFIAEGKMKPAGTLSIEIAKQNGSWDTAYDSQRNATIPDDLIAAFQKNPEAKAFFDTLNNVNKYAILYRIQVAKTVEKREEKLAQLIEMLNQKKKIHDN